MSLKLPAPSRVREVTEAEKEKGEEKEGRLRGGELEELRGAAVLRIQDVYPGSQIRCFPFRIPDPESRVDKISDPGSGYASKNLSIFKSQNL